MTHRYRTGLDADDATSPSDILDDVQATDAVSTEETYAAQQQAQAALAAQALLAQQQQQMMMRRHHVWQRMNGTTFRTRPGTWQDHKAFRLAASGRLIRVSGATMTGYAGELKYQVVNPHGALLRWREGEPMQNSKPIAYGAIVMGTPRGDGYIVEISSGGVNAWVNALDLNQVTSAEPSPVLASGEYVGDGGMMPATGCPQGQTWSDWYGKCVAIIPPPPPAPVSSTQTSGEYVGDMMPATGCPAGTWWSDYYGKCVPNIPAPPPPAPMPDTFEQWRHQHQTSGDFAGYGWEVDAVGAPPPPNANDVQDQSTAPPHLTAPSASSTQAHAQGQPSPIVNVQHPAVAQNAAPEHHAAANAADANVHAQAAQAIAAHPQAPGTGAEKHAQHAFEHASLAANHANLAAVNPAHAHEHAHQAAVHSHYAKRHAAHVRREGQQRGWHHDFGEHGRGLFHGLFRNHLRHEHGFSRHFHAHPEWHGYGHPAWRSGIHPMWSSHRAECAHRSGPHGLFGFLFGWNQRYCAIERIHHPMGLASYRLTPSGMQEGALLDDDMVEANNQFTSQTGQAPPDADAGPMPGSDDKASGAQTPDAGNDDSSDDDGDADDAADSTDQSAASTTTQGWFTGWSDQAMELQAQDEASRRTRSQRGSSRRTTRRATTGTRHMTTPQERAMINQQLEGDMGGYGGYGGDDMDDDMSGGGGGMGPATSMWGGPHAWHHHHHPHHEHHESMPMMPAPQQQHTTWLYGGGTTNPYDPNAQHPYGAVNW